MASIKRHMMARYCPARQLNADETPPNLHRTCAAERRAPYPAVVAAVWADWFEAETLRYVGFEGTRTFT